MHNRRNAMTTIITDELKNKLSKRHRVHKANLNKWKFYRVSYEGGSDYVDADMLYRYKNEQDGEYIRRKESSFIDNISRTVITRKNALLFENKIKRDFGSLGTVEDNKILEDFMEDADYEGRSFENFMKYCSREAAITGIAHIFCMKPAVKTVSGLDDKVKGVRPYLSVVSAENVLDWVYRRDIMGKPTLEMMKIIEWQEGFEARIKIFYQDHIETYDVRYDVNYDGVITDQIVEATRLEDIPNAIGFIPVIPLYHERCGEFGLGHSEITDISLNQKSIYNDYMGIDSGIKLVNSPLLICMQDQKITLGPGGTIILTPEQMQLGWKPEYAQPGGAVNIQAVSSIIAQKNDMTERNSNLDSISGVNAHKTATEAMMKKSPLDGELISHVAELELAEEKIFTTYAIYDGKEWDGNIQYSKTFNTNDKAGDMTILTMAYDLVKTPEVLAYIEKSVTKIIAEDEDDLALLEKAIKKTDFSIKLEDDIQVEMVDGPPMKKDENNLPKNQE